MTEKLCHPTSGGDGINIPGNVYGYGGKHLFKPCTCCVSSQPHCKWEKKQMKRMAKELSQQSAIVYYRAVNIKGATHSWCMAIWLIRYSQGSFPLIALTSLFHVMVPMVISPL